MGLPQAAANAALDARRRRAVDFPTPPDLLELLGDGDRERGAGILRQVHAEMAARKRSMPQATHVIQLEPGDHVSVFTLIGERRIS